MLCPIHIQYLVYLSKNNVYKHNIPQSLVIIIF